MARAPHPSQSLMDPALREAAGFATRTLETLLPVPGGPETRLLEAMRAAALAPGARRLHAFLVLQSGRLFGIDRRPLGRVVAAVECVHAYGQTHGGPGLLPADESPGPALAEAFGETTAMLAGDALLALAFTLLGSGEAIGDPYIRAELMLKLAQSAGHTGLAGGQMLETVFADGTGGAPPPLPEISRLQRMKTAALTIFCCEAGAMLGRASPPARHALSAYGQDIGLAFHIAADLAADTAAAPEPSIVSALGVERARAQAAALCAQAVRHLDLFDEKADLLRAAADVARGLAGATAV